MAIKNGWIQIKDVTDKYKVKEFSTIYKISLANAETIQLARELNAKLTLADELEVREILTQNNIKIRGCIGILIEAVRKSS